MQTAGNLCRPPVRSLTSKIKTALISARWTATCRRGRQRDTWRILRRAARIQRHAGIEPGQIADLVLSFGFTPAAVDVNGDQMATWTYQRRTLTTEKTSVVTSKPPLLFRKDGPVVFTKNYVKHTLLSKKEYPQGVQGMITQTHTNFLGKVTHVTIRLPNGKFVREVPVRYFLA
jgi:hypothetical protein